MEIIEEFENKDGINVKYKLTIPENIIGIESIICLMKCLTKSKNKSWDCQSIKEYISMIHLKDALFKSKIIYNNSTIEWRTDFFSKFPDDLQEWLQPFDKTYDSTTNTMRIEISEEELFYLKLKYENYITEGVLHKIIVEEI